LSKATTYTQVVGVLIDRLKNNKIGRPIYLAGEALLLTDREGFINSKSRPALSTIIANRLKPIPMNTDWKSRKVFNPM